jgi:hypothetical protein
MTQNVMGLPAQRLAYNPSALETPLRSLSRRMMRLLFAVIEIAFYVGLYVLIYHVRLPEERDSSIKRMTPRQVRRWLNGPWPKSHYFRKNGGAYCFRPNAEGRKDPYGDHLLCPPSGASIASVAACGTWSSCS